MLVTQRISCEHVLHRRRLDATVSGRCSSAAKSNGVAMVVLDGANIAWTYGKHHAALRSGRKHPMSEGLMQALHHAPWKDAGLRTMAFLPRHYVEGQLHHLLDGGSPDTALHEKVMRVHRGHHGDVWRCLPLYEEYIMGRVILVDCSMGRSGKLDDDAQMLAYARNSREGAYICSNDRFREHAKKPVPGFPTKRSLQSWCSQMRVGYRFVHEDGKLVFTPDRELEAVEIHPG